MNIATFVSIEMYNLEQRIAIIKWYIQAESAEEVIGRFIFAFPDTPVPSNKTILNIFNKFNSRGCVTSCRKCNSDEDKQVTRPSSVKRGEKISKSVNGSGFGDDRNNAVGTPRSKTTLTNKTPKTRTTNNN